MSNYSSLKEKKREEEKQKQREENGGGEEKKGRREKKVKELKKGWSWDGDGKDEGKESFTLWNVEMSSLNQELHQENVQTL